MYIIDNRLAYLYASVLAIFFISHSWCSSSNPLLWYVNIYIYILLALYPLPHTVIDTKNKHHIDLNFNRIELWVLINVGSLVWFDVCDWDIWQAMLLGTILCTSLFTLQSPEKILKTLY